MHITRSFSWTGGIEEAFDPVQALQHAAGSLTALSTKYRDLRHGPHIPQPHLTVRFAKVHQLTWVTQQFAHVGSLLWAFPNLRMLRVGHIRLDTPGYGLQGSGISLDTMQQHRRFNVSAQTAQSQFVKLDCLEGNILSLWTLGLKCPVDRIETAIRSRQDAKVGQLVVLLHDASPKHLVLTTYPRHVKELGRVLNFPTVEVFELRIDVMDHSDVLAGLVR